MKPKIKNKRWSKEFEEPIRRSWKRKRVFEFNHKTRRPVFSIDTPPPYVDAPVHIGQAVTYTIMDFIARFKRMRGFDVLFPLGLDRNGLPIEMAVERKFNVSIQDTPREKFITLCKKLLEQSSLESLDSFYKLGHSYTSWKHGEEIGELYYTDSDSYRKTTQETFIDLWKSGMIYQAKRISNYCPGCRTTIADAEIEYKNLSSDFVHVKWKVRETGESITIATTRPELICTCGMIIYNPKDERYRHLKGKHAVLPIYEKEVPIMPHTSAKIETGSGLAMMCSFGDYTDIRFFREMKLKPIVAINQDGTMNEHAGFLEGMSVDDARKKMIEILKSQDLIEKEQKVMHRTPVCERSRNPIEFVSISEYYLKQLNMKKNIVRVSNRIKFFSKRSKQILLDWIDTLSMDWAVSRRRYYATEIPLWYCKKCGETIVPPKGKYYQPWKEKPPVKKCPKCGGKDFIGEERVFDTWFDSSISPLYVLGYGRKNGFFKKSVPCSLRPQGKEIVRTWLYYTLLRSYQLTKKPIFENIWIHYHVLDEKGNKMSKSLGNVIDPLDVVKRFGAEPFRIWCALEGNITLSDLRCSYERIEGASKFLTKLWNIARFVSTFRVRKTKHSLLETDKWILNEINRIAKETSECYENFDFHRPVSDLKHFIWETFASHYLELVKSRAYNQDRKFTKAEQAAAIHTLNEVLEKILLLLAPITPFITHKLYKDIFGKIVEEQKFPKPDRKYTGKRIGFKTEELMELSSRIWKAKKDKGLSLKAPIRKATIPEKFRKIEKDLIETHNIQHLEYGDKLKIRL
ncbi:MAG: valine--tRNA ligase [Candidatus Aenigmatarchaeota archaeon]|nr:MAG: valine--tRNA ligase [Candidatus Aenigmarchaeota archaeon]